MEWHCKSVLLNHTKPKVDLTARLQLTGPTCILEGVCHRLTKTELQNCQHFV